MSNPAPTSSALTVETRIWLAITAVLVLAAGLYWPGLGGPFVLDDLQNIVDVYLPEKDWNSFVYMITHNDSGMLGRVVSIVSFVLSGWQYDLEPWGYKLHNLLLHLLTGVVLFKVLERTLRLIHTTAPPLNATVAAGVAAAFWLMHPLQVSTVLYVVQRMSMLAALFVLLALWTYLTFRSESNWSRRHWLLAFTLYPLLQLLALFSKESGALLPFFILAYEIVVFRGIERWRQQAKPQQLFLAVFVAFPLAVGGLYFTTHTATLLDYSVRNFSLAERLMTQLHVLPFYFKLILLPRVRDMSLFHDDFPVTRELDAVTALLLLAFAAVVTAVFLLRKRAPVLALGLGWFLAAHLLESTVIPLELVFEHRNYLALAGLLLPLVHYVLQYREVKLGRALLGLFFMVYLLQTLARVQEWSNEELMFVQAVADHPDSPRARTSLANILTLQGKYVEATEQLEAAAVADPRDAGPLLHQLFNRCLLGEQAPELFERTLTVLTTYPASIYAMNAIDNIFRTINKEQCKQLTQDDMNRLVDAAVSQPGNGRSALISGYLTRFKAIHAFLSGNYPEGVVYMRLAHEATRDNMMLVDLVETQITVGQLGDAAETLQALREVDAAGSGTETYQIVRLEQKLQEARDKPPVTAAPEGLPPPAPVSGTAL